MKTLQKLMCTADVSQVIQQFSRISRWSTQPPCAEPVATVLKEGDSDANNLHTNLTWWITKSSCSYTVTSWCCKYPTKLPVFKQFQMVIPVRFYTPTVSFKFKFLDFVHLKGGTSHQNTLRRKKKKDPASAKKMSEQSVLMLSKINSMVSSFDQFGTPIALWKFRDIRPWFTTGR